MAKELENSLERFARPASSSGFQIAAVVAIVLLAAAIVATAVSSFLVAGALSGLSLVAVIALVLVSSRSRKNASAQSAASRILWEPAEPEVQRQTLHVAVGEISRILKVQPEGVGELQTAFIVGEDLALRQIQLEENVPVMRHVAVGGVPFDAAFTKETILVCCEVCFLVSPELGQDRVAAMMRKVGSVKRSIAEMNIGLEVRLMVILVTQMADGEVTKLRETLSTKRFSSTPVDIDIRLMDFEGLQRVYVLSEEDVRKVV